MASVGVLVQEEGVLLLDLGQSTLMAITRHSIWRVSGCPTERACDGSARRRVETRRFYCDACGRELATEFSTVVVRISPLEGNPPTWTARTVEQLVGAWGDHDPLTTTLLAQQVQELVEGAFSGD